MFKVEQVFFIQKTMPLLPQNGTLGMQRAAHLLRRATFGATKAQIDSYAGLSRKQSHNYLPQIYRLLLHL